MAKSRDQLNSELKSFVSEVTARYNVYAVVLFGSYAEGKAHDYSDIDLAVFSDDFGGNVLEDMKALFKLRRKIDTDIEPLPFTKRDFFEHSPADFVNQILTRGRIIYRDGTTLF